MGVESRVNVSIYGNNHYTITKMHRVEMYLPTVRLGLTVRYSAVGLGLTVCYCAVGLGFDTCTVMGLGLTVRYSAVGLG